MASNLLAMLVSDIHSLPTSTALARGQVRNNPKDGAEKTSELATARAQHGRANKPGEMCGRKSASKTASSCEASSINDVQNGNFKARNSIFCGVPNLEARGRSTHMDGTWLSHPDMEVLIEGPWLNPGCIAWQICGVSSGHS